MHELAVSQSILNIALDNANKASAKQIKFIYLEIGQMASLVDDSINFYWDIISEGTIAQGALLVFHRIPVEMKCWDCGTIFSPNENTFDCPNCKSIKVQVVSGEEMRVESIEVE